MGRGRPYYFGLLVLSLWGTSVHAQPAFPITTENSTESSVLALPELGLQRFDRVAQFHSQLRAAGNGEELQASEAFYDQVKQALETFLIHPNHEDWMIYRVQLEDSNIEPRTPTYEAYFWSIISQFANQRFPRASQRSNFLRHIVAALDPRDPVDRYHGVELIKPILTEADILAEIEQYGSASSWKLFMPLQEMMNFSMEFSGSDDSTSLWDYFAQDHLEGDRIRFYRVDPVGLEGVGWTSNQLKQGKKLDDFLESGDYHQQVLARLMQHHLSETEPEGSYFVGVFSDLADALELAIFDESGKRRKTPLGIYEVLLSKTDVMVNTQNTQVRKKQYLVKDEIQPSAVVRAWTLSEVLDKHRELSPESRTTVASTPVATSSQPPSPSREAIEDLFAQLEKTQDPKQVRMLFHKISEHLERQTGLSDTEKEEFLFRQLELLTLPKFQVIRDELAEVSSNLYSTSTYFGLPLLIKHMAQAAFGSSHSTQARDMLRHTDEYLVSHALYVMDSAFKDVTKKGFTKSYEAFKRYLLKNFVTSSLFQRVFGAGETSQVAAVKNYRVVAGMLKLQAIVLAALMYSQWWRTGKLDAKQLTLSWLSILIPQALIHIGAYVIWVKILHRTWQLKTFTGAGALLTVLEIGLTAYFADELQRFFQHTAYRFSTIRDLKKKWRALEEKVRVDELSAQEVIDFYTDDVAPAFQSFRNFLLYTVYEANRDYLEEFEQLRKTYDKLYAASLERQRRLQHFIQAKARLVLYQRVHGTRRPQVSSWGQPQPQNERLVLWQQIENGQDITAGVMRRLEDDLFSARLVLEPFATQTGRLGLLPGTVGPLTPEEIYANAKYDLFRVDQEIFGLMTRSDWKARYETQAQGFHDEKVQALGQVMKNLHTAAKQNFTSRAFLDFRRTGSREDFEDYQRLKALSSQDPEVIQATPLSNLIQQISILERMTKDLQRQSPSERSRALIQFFQEETLVMQIELAQMVAFLESPPTIELDEATEAEFEREFNLRNDVMPDVTQWQNDYAPRSELIENSGLLLPPS